MNKSCKLIYKDGNDKTKGYEISEGKNKKETPEELRCLLKKGKTSPTLL